MDKLLPDTGYLSALKRYVLTKAGIQSLSPGDCRTISLRIKETTGKVVSETTLKRFLGFAKKNYNFSAYTLNALCDYIGFSGWESFRNSIEPDLARARSADDIWSDFYRKSHEVSSISLQSLKDHSGIPFQYTVSRSAIETDFEIFMEEDYPCFGLIGVSGMGKSIQMAHLAEKFFLTENAAYQNSIFWLFKRGALFDFIPHDIYLEETLYEQFGLRSEFNFIDYFRSRPEDVPGKLVLMMDGFDDYLYQSEKRDKVFQQFSDLLSYLRDIRWVKLVFSMRPATWDILKTKMDTSAFLRKKWFPGVSYQSNLKSNMGALLPAELEKVFDSSPFRLHNRQGDLHSLLRYPVFLTTYFQHLERNELSNSAIGDVSFFKLISSYLGDRIHRANLDIERWFLVKKMLRISISDNGCENSVDEAELLSGLFDDSSHIIAYRELLQCGLLQQERGGDRGCRVRFVDESLYVYLLFYAIAKDKDISVEELFTQVKQKFHAFPKKTLLLKSIFWHLLEKRTDDILKPFYSGCFEIDDKAILILFITDYIHSFPQALSGEVVAAFIKEAVSFFTNHLFYINDLNEAYDTAIKYLEKCASDADRMNLLTIRAILSVLKLDQKAIYGVIEEMQQLQQPASGERYPIQPVEILQHLFDLQETEPVANNTLPDPLASFVANGSYFSKKELDNEILLSYQLTGLILQMCFATKPFLILIEKIRTTHPKALTSEDHPELQALLEIQEMFSMDSKTNTTSAQVKNMLNDPVFPAQDDKSTSYYSIFLLLLEGDDHLQKEEHEAAARRFSKAYKLCRANNYALLQIVIALRLIKLYRNGKQFDHPVGLIREIRQKTVHLALPIREIFLQKVMMEVD